MCPPARAQPGERCALGRRQLVPLIEIDPTNVAIAQRHIACLGLALSVVKADAGSTDASAGLVPADFVLLSGIMGDISAADIERLVHLSPQFCAPAATIIWTRGRRDHQLPIGKRSLHGPDPYVSALFDAWVSAGAAS
ncbi:MAG: class I SAM-dependent methyltransferase [Jatrophihabitans sp.]